MRYYTLMCVTIITAISHLLYATEYEETKNKPHTNMQQKKAANEQQLKQALLEQHNQNKQDTWHVSASLYTLLKQAGGYFD